MKPWVLAGAALGVAVALWAQPRQQPRVDMPHKAGTCLVYNTHKFEDGSKSYQVTCAAPVPDSLIIKLP